jgi:molybdate transport system substrate-binding protein
VGRKDLLALAGVAVLALVACGDDDDTGGGSEAESGGAIAAVHTVAPLQPVVSELVTTYNDTSDGGIELAVEAPDVAVQAVSQGTPAILPGLWLEGVDADGVVIGRNLAIIVVPADNPAQVTGVDAFVPGSGLDTQICGANTSAGNVATQVLLLGGVAPDPSRIDEGCDADAVARVASGELDAALVFRGNVEIPEGVELVNLSEDRNVVIDVGYAPAASDPGADSFQVFLESDAATQILSQHGFLP